MVIQCLKTNLYSMEIPEHFLVLLHTQGLQPGIYGDVFTGHHLLSLQDNSTKEIKEIQSSFVIPNHFYKTETELFKCFLSKTILRKKSNQQTLSLSDRSKKKNGDKIGQMLLSQTILNYKRIQSIKLKFVYAL